MNLFVTGDPDFNHVGGCQNDGPILGALNNRCRMIIGFPKGTIILTTAHILWIWYQS